MKSTFLILFAGVLFFTSCKKDTPPQPTYSITGKWYVVQTRLTETPAGEPSRVTYINRNHTDYLLFNADNTGEDAFTPYGGVQGKRSFTFRRADKSITVTYTGNEIIEKQIKSINDNSLTLSQPYKDSNGNVAGTYEVDYTNQ